MKFLWLLILPEICFGYTLYGTKRYGRTDPHMNPAWVPLPVYRQQPEYTHAPAYYEHVVYPYTQDFSDEYYYPTKPILHYPQYAMVRPIHNLEMYQGYPHLYTPESRRPMYNPYGDYDAPEPMESLHDEISQEEEREEREDSLPIGQETWFEDDAPATQWKSPNYDDVNAAFLQNLILSEMYKDSLAKENVNKNRDKSDLFLDDADLEPEKNIYADRNTRDSEDIDVRELKALAGKPFYHVPKTNKIYSNNYDNVEYGTVKTNTGFAPSSKSDSEKESKQYYDDQKYFNEDYPNDDAWINWDSKRSVEIKPLKKYTPKKVTSNGKFNKNLLHSTSTSSPTSTTSIRPTAIKDGQKEFALARPSTPVRQILPDSVMKMLATESNQKKRSPSVYETIKHLLTMDAEISKNSDVEPRLKKRFVATENDLVGELRGLKSRNRA